VEPPRPRVLIFVIAYQAEDTLHAVLDRIPSEIFEKYACEVLVVDDASADQTISVARDYARESPRVPLTILQNGVNQGYGGNQKVGYTYAIRHGFDVVVMVHGDGQYAPEELPRMIAPVAEGRSDAVFGSRMSTPFGALRGGMPFYKFVGNRILTAAQNAILRSTLTEFHSGYRAYRVETLAAIPFLLASNDFHFDTEIIIQLLHRGSRIEEIPIPTFYGREISRVDGLSYAKNVMVATVGSALHRAGLMYRRRFDPDPPSREPRRELKLGYTSSHQLALDAVPANAKVVDLAPGVGHLPAELQRRGVDVDVADGPAADLSGYSHILLVDLLGHVDDPESFLEELRDGFTFDEQTLLVTTGNVAFIVPRLMLLLGQLNYGKEGILDRKHRRLFTFRSLAALLADAGLDVEEVRGIPAPMPKAVGDNVVARALLRLNEHLIRLSPTLFSYQIMVVAKSRPTVRYVLDEAMDRVGPAPHRAGEERP